MEGEDEEGDGWVTSYTRSRRMGSDHQSLTDGDACSPVGQLDYDLSSTSPAAVYIVYK